MEELHEDIKMHLDLDRATPTHTQYWEALLVVCDWELAEARKKDTLDRARVRGELLPAELLAEERGLHSSVEADVKNLLQGKTYGELETLQSQIEAQMRSGTAKVVEYWEAILKRPHIYKAKACLKEIHAKMLHRNLERLEQPRESEDNVERDQSSTPKVEDTGHDKKDDQPLSPEPILNEETEEAEEAGSYSPHLLHGEENEEAIDPKEDKAMLERKRVAVLEEQQRQIQEALASRTIPSVDNLEMKAAMKAMGAMVDGDDEFGKSDEVNLDSQVYWWHDKYRPRKPKYSVFTLGTSGTSTIKLTMTMTTHPQRLYKVTDSTYFTLISLTKQKLLFTL